MCNKMLSNVGEKSNNALGGGEGERGSKIVKLRAIFNEEPLKDV